MLASRPKFAVFRAVSYLAWSMLIVLMLGYNDTLHFGDLKKKIKEKMLSMC